MKKYNSLSNKLNKLMKKHHKKNIKYAKRFNKLYDQRAKLVKKTNDKTYESEPHE